jgi:excisionase family DNA binding protein
VQVNGVRRWIPLVAATAAAQRLSDKLRDERNTKRAHERNARLINLETTMAVTKLTPRPQIADPMMNLFEAAAYLGIAAETLKKWTTYRRIPYTKLGRLNRYRRSDLDAYLDAHRVPVAK